MDRLSEQVVVLLRDLLAGYSGAAAGARPPTVTPVAAGRAATAAADARAAAMEELLEIRPGADHGIPEYGRPGAAVHRIIFAGEPAGSGGSGEGTACAVRSKHVMYHLEAPALVIVDRAFAFMAVGGTVVDGIVVRDDPLVAMLRSYFETLWSRAAPCTAAPGGDDTFSPVAARILTLLADGYRDAAVAQSLGLSVRTVRRHIAQSADRLNATTRFAIGFQAYRQDWLGSR